MEVAKLLMMTKQDADESRDEYSEDVVAGAKRKLESEDDEYPLGNTDI